MRTFDLEQEIGRNQVVVVDSALNYTNTVDWTRAMSLIVADEANILIPRNDGSMVRSARLTFPRPLVVSLHRFVGTPIRKMKDSDPATRTMILVRDNWTCYICKEYGDTIEHLMPKSRGGRFTWGNLAVACSPCNEAKADLTPQEFGVAWPKIPTTLVHRRREALQQAIYRRLEEMASL